MFKIDYNFQRGGPEYHHTLPAEEDRNNSIFVALGGTIKEKIHCFK